MKIDDKLLDKLQDLSYISIDDNKKDDMKKSLSEIVSYMDKLSTIETDSNDTCSNIQAGILADDNVIDSKIDLNLLNKSENDFFIVPKIIE
jgi:aspartyl-tRNA(Asn)/glutamyl-tRNA(Gln) amidotransferase subunit C